MSLESFKYLKLSSCVQDLSIPRSYSQKIPGDSLGTFCNPVWAIHARPGSGVRNLEVSSPNQHIHALQNHPSEFHLTLRPVLTVRKVRFHETMFVFTLVHCTYALGSIYFHVFPQKPRVRSGLPKFEGSSTQAARPPNHKSSLRDVSEFLGPGEVVGTPPC